MSKRISDLADIAGLDPEMIRGKYDERFRYETSKGNGTRKSLKLAAAMVRAIHSPRPSAPGYEHSPVRPAWIVDTKNEKQYRYDPSTDRFSLYVTYGVNTGGKNKELRHTATEVEL